MMTPQEYEEGIRGLKKSLNAVILAHYYQDSEIQDLADFVGDSLDLSRKAASTTADVIVFCGVHFMAETAKILNPHKPVLLPDLLAGCSLSEGCPPPAFKKFREAHPDHVAITYINCSAEVKALSDIICTSSNAEKIVAQIPKDQPILFSPDKNLGAYIQKKTGRPMTLWNGSCIVHETFSERKLIGLQMEHPDAELIAHPECEEHILAKASFIGSTSMLLKYVQDSPRTKFIVGTEFGIVHQMEKSTTGKTFLPLPPEANCACNECPHMKRNTLEKLYLCMRDMSPQITMDPDLLARARTPIDRMLAMS
ncbi:MAG: quinolinate synthase NadA [Bacteroidetes bacterium]|nr:quinolinate synthase NadA [Bacteroidota bacterium]